MAKPLMSDAEIKHRKKVQGTISRTTSTLGLTGLGLLGAGAVAAKKPGVLKPLQRTKAGKNITPAKFKSAATTGGIISGGIGGVGGYNFAAYTNAESRKRTPTVVKKDMDDQMDFGLGGIRQGSAERGKEDAFGEDKIEKAYDPEKKRQRRLDAYSTGVAMGAGAAGAGAALQGKKSVKGLKDFSGHLKAAPVSLKAERASKLKGAAGLKTGLKSARTAGGLGAAAIGGAIAADRISSYKSKRGGSFKPLRRGSY